MYKSYSYNNMPKAITDKPKPPPERRPEPQKPSEPKEREEKQGLLGRLETDDIILMIVIAALLLDDCDDKLLIAALAFIFLSDFL